MKKTILLIAALAVIVFVARRFGPKMANIDWEQRFEQMPDNAPPKWMFRNISAIRDNTDRILELVDQDADRGAGSEVVADLEL